MKYSDISVHIEEGVARLTVLRPDKLNAMRNETADELSDALDRIEDDRNVRSAILTGSGRAFGAGYDLSTIPTDEAPNLYEVLDRHFNPLIRRMRASRLPIVSSINGPCAGVSVAIALSGDIVIAARSAYLYEPFVGLSLVPDGGNSLILPTIAGRIRASAAILLEDRITAEEAHTWGLFWKIFDDEILAEKATQIALDLATKSHQAIAASKRLINKACETGLDAQLDAERDIQHAMGQRPEMKKQIHDYFHRA
ncbi:enoyl-CoA hydratase-related protein [Sneathiella marina]|uniref:Enoyl-CoA hydratase-related protein n=1 Tax=Sneathiella marina TaxID=2950108 RepID=A0ABY4WCV7_9PROT|nr:enoyl-CoA hydratase-related protein [Sneathiella marina]USG62471.1 enoyl-CoA hydratase-related protein [Sneathiella marina]